MASKPPPKRQKYCIQYTGNSSKRWDGKEIWVDGEWVEELYNPSELTDGKRIRLPWKGKQGRVTYWEGVIVNTDKPEPRRKPPVTPKCEEPSKKKPKREKKKTIG